MKTSYFFSSKLYSSMDLVNIAGLSPKEFRLKYPNMKQYDPLKPPRELVLDYKSGRLSEKEYKKIYYKQLEKLDVFEIYNDLKNSIILCWEKPDKFCHRHIVSEWITNLTGNKIEEL